jgi:DNA-binding GntR family transcriptional regulator
VIIHCHASSFAFTSNFQSIATMPRAKTVVTQPRLRNTEFNLRAWNKARREHHTILKRIESQDLPAGKSQELKSVS